MAEISLLGRRGVPAATGTDEPKARRGGFEPGLAAAVANAAAVLPMAVVRGVVIGYSASPEFPARRGGLALVALSPSYYLPPTSTYDPNILGGLADATGPPSYAF